MPNTTNGYWSFATVANDCGRYEAYGITWNPGKLKELTADIRAAAGYDKQTIITSRYLMVKNFPYRGLMKGYGRKSHEELQEFKDAGWIELGRFPGNHTQTYNSLFGSNDNFFEPYFMVLLGLVVKPDILQKCLEVESQFKTPELV